MSTSDGGSHGQLRHGASSAGRALVRDAIRMMSPHAEVSDVRDDHDKHAEGAVAST